VTIRRVYPQVTLPDGRNTLCLLPAKFNKKLWIRRGGYLIIDQGEQGGDNRVTGTIAAVLYEPDVRALKKLPGVW
jgi:probable RNA-binding protein EIF1AD